MRIKSWLKEIRLKPFDLILLSILTLLSFTPWMISFFHVEGENVTYKAELSVHNHLIKTFPLDKDTTYIYKDIDGDTNTIVVKDGKIRITEANCSDQVCVRRGWISKGGDTIVCLPHELVIEVVASDGSQDGSVIY